MSTQQNLRRRANVFNNANVDIIVVLKDEALHRKLNGIGQVTAAERKAAAEENKAAAAAAAKSMGVTARFAYGGSALYGFATSASPVLVTNIEADPRVAYVENDGIIELSPIEMGEDRRRLAPPPDKGHNKDKGDGGGGDGPAQTIPWGIARVNGGKTYTGDGRAWVIDSGIDLDHPDQLDTANSDSFVYKGTRLTDPDDQNGHGMYASLLIQSAAVQIVIRLSPLQTSMIIGTHVAGTIAAIDNDIGVIGVAAGADVVSVR